MGPTVTTKLVVKDAAFKAKLNRASKSVKSYGKATKGAAKSTQTFSKKLLNLGSVAAGRFRDRMKSATGATSLLDAGFGKLAIGAGAVVAGIGLVVSKIGELTQRARESAT